MPHPRIEDWKSQMRRGLLEYCLLLALKNYPKYGYEIIIFLSRWPFIASTESTIYPLLRRLLNAGLLTSTWQPNTDGLPPRKYYALTPEGQEYLKELQSEWKNLIQDISTLESESE